MKVTRRSGVIGVDQSQSLMKPRAAKPAPPSPGFRNAPPCSTSWGSSLDTIDPAFGNGYGFMNAFPVARMWRDAKVLEIGEGTSEVQRMLIARDLGL